jgi:hypothetical protein
MSAVADVSTTPGTSVPEGWLTGTWTIDVADKVDIVLDVQAFRAEA